MASSRTTPTGRGNRPSGRRRFFNYPRSHVRGFRRWLPSWRVVLGTFLTGFALVAGVVIAAYATTTVPKTLPEVSKQATTIYWADGTELGKLADQNREIVDFSTLPEYVGNAVVASEDSTFWTNSGVDVRGIGRAVLNNLQGKPRQGASTLTQQYVETYLVGRSDADKGSLQEYAGKFREAILALKIGQSQDKKEVLGNYLNTIYFGRGAYGIQAAAQAYFGKNAADLTVSESAMLAGLIPSPVRWDPAVDLTKSTQRWDRTLDRMVDGGFITADERAAAVFPEFKPKDQNNQRVGQNGFVMDAVIKELVDSQQFTEEDLETEGLKITTTIDPRLQNLAAEVAATPFQGDHPADPNLHPSIVSINPANGEVVTMYGGTTYPGFNYATQGTAQAGSTFKPFTLVGALESGKTLADRYDAPKAKEFGDWKVTNFGNAGFGNIDLLRATQDSVNTVYAELNIEDGPEVTADVAQRAGITTPVEAVRANVLGITPVTTLELTRAYATFAAQGYRTTPHVVREVTSLDGTLRYQGPTAQEQVFAPDVMAAATYAMTQVVEKGSGETAKELGRPVAGKTGTSNDNQSAWFAGYIPQLATVVGINQSTDQGNQQITRFGKWATMRNQEITGSTWPATAWTQYMEGAVSTLGLEPQDFPDYKPPRSTPSPSVTEEPTEAPTEAPTPDEQPTPQVEMVDVPGDLVGKPIANVQQALQRLGLAVRTQSQASDQPKGTVLQVQSGGTQVPNGSTIVVVVSTGAPAQPTPAPTPTESTPPDGGDGSGGGNAGGGGGGGGNGGGTNP